MIIANLDGESFLGGCLQALEGQTFRDFEVIVVDNGSRDRSLEIIRNDFPRVKVIPLKENRGFSAANNIGYEIAAGRYIAPLNNDALPEPGWLAALHGAAEGDGTVGMVASKIYLGSEGRILDSAGMLIFPDGMSRQRGRGEKDQGQYDQAAEVLFPSACAALYRRRMLEETGFFDGDFVSYCEDSDLGLRARLLGWQAVLAPGAVVRHLYSRTGGEYSLFKAYHVERNHCWVLLKNFPAAAVALSPLHTVRRFGVQAFGLLAGKGSPARFAGQAGKGAVLRCMLGAYRDAVAGTAAMVRKRKAIWRGRKVEVGDYRRLLKRHRISARELVLRE